ARSPRSAGAAAARGAASGDAARSSGNRRSPAADAGLPDARTTAAPAGQPQCWPGGTTPPDPPARAWPGGTTPPDPPARAWPGGTTPPDPPARAWPGTSIRQRSLVTPSSRALEAPERVQLGRGRGGDDLRLRRDGQVPAGALLGGGGRYPRVQPGHGELERLRIGLEDTQVGDDLLGPGAGEPEPLAVPRARPVADRGDEVDAFDERAVALPDHDDHLTARGGDLRRAARTGQPHLGATVIPADHGRVDVAELVDLGGTEEADVDAAGLQPVVEDLGDAHHRVRRLGQHAVTDRQRQLAGLGPDRARLVDQHQRRRVRGPRQVGGRTGQPDPDETRHA